MSFRQTVLNARFGCLRFDYSGLNTCLNKLSACAPYFNDAINKTENPRRKRKMRRADFGWFSFPRLGCCALEFTEIRVYSLLQILNIDESVEVYNFQVKFAFQGFVRDL